MMFKIYGLARKEVRKKKKKKNEVSVFIVCDLEFYSQQ